MCKAEAKQEQQTQTAERRRYGKAKELPSLGEIRAAVPAHCFERSLVKSTLYLARDLALCGALLYAARTYLPVYELSDQPLAVLGWVAYTIVQGTALTGLWVLAHEAGHQAFSNYGMVNDLVGYVLHTALLVPYFSWAYTHGVHHARVNHILDGESHVPDIERKVSKMYQKVVDVIGDEAFAVLQVFLHLLLGWPLYLALGITGSKRRADGERYSKAALKRPNHFNPLSELFPDRMRLKVGLSTVGVVAVFVALGYWASLEGARTVLLQYGLPYLVVNAYLVGFTWLQHTHPDVPHLGEEEWTWVAGTVLTVDRPYPAFIDVLTHRIGSTHVAHHLFSRMPWYHAQEATKHLKAFLEPRGLYIYDPTPWYRALVETGRECHFLEDVNGVQYFKKVSAGGGAKKVN